MHSFTCGCGWVVRGKASATNVKLRGTCSAGCWAGKGGSKAADVKPPHKQPQQAQQPQPNQPGYTPVLNAWNNSTAADSNDARMEDGADVYGAGGNDSGGSADGPSEAEGAATKLEGLRGDEACCKALIKAAKLQKVPLAVETNTPQSSGATPHHRA